MLKTTTWQLHLPYCCLIVKPITNGNNISQIKQTPQTLTTVCLLQYKHNWQ